MNEKRSAGTHQHPMIPLEKGKTDAVIFDLDGVITDTRRAHEAAWKQLFDEYLKEQTHQSDVAPFSREDYSEYLDGKPRYDGVRDFLASRHIQLPWGDPADSPEQETICGLGNRKNRHFNRWLEDNRVDTFPDALELLNRLNSIGIPTAIISASKNCEAVLANAGIADLFTVKVDGVDMAELGLPGKPDPAIFLQAAERLDIGAERAVVIEDALAGVKAGDRGGFALVVGVNREESSHAEALRKAGAHVVTDTLSMLLEGGERHISPAPLDDIPSVWDSRDALTERLRGKHIALFLDYDGTLTPIVEDYRKAQLSAAMREVVDQVAATCTVAIISGRDLQDVRKLVDLDQVFYAGSHGFDIAGPEGFHQEVQQGKQFLPDLDAAETALSEKLEDIKGAAVERKRFSIAVHYRQVAEDDVPVVEQIVDRVLSDHSRLRSSRGKKVFDVKPHTDWDKGQAVLWLLERYDLDGADVLPLYIGDDTTDEDAFRVLRQQERGEEGGIAIVVRDDDSRRRTLAHYALEDTDDVAHLLTWLATITETGGKE